MEGIDVIVWDSPGLQDGTENKSDYIQDMSTRIKEVDLVIYCLKMDDTRLRDEDLKAMRILTEVFGKRLWENAVFALTFANKVENPDAANDSLVAAKKYFTEELEEWEKAFRQKLPAEAKIDLAEYERIPKVPTGPLKRLQLPDRENWLTEFWIRCFERMKVGSRVNLFNINRSRIHLDSRVHEEERLEPSVSFYSHRTCTWNQCTFNQYYTIPASSTPPLSEVTPSALSFFHGAQSERNSPSPRNTEVLSSSETSSNGGYSSNDNLPSTTYTTWGSWQFSQPAAGSWCTNRRFPWTQIWL